MTTGHVLVRGSVESDPLQHKLRTQELYRLKIEPRRTVDDHNGGLEDQNGALEGL
jgi:hypothetical protein